MAQLAVTTMRKVRGDLIGNFRIANAQQLYIGGYAALNSSGLLVPFSGANGQLLVGRIQSGAQPGTDGTLTLLGDTSASIPPEAVVNLAPEILEKVTVAGASSLALAIGKPVYLNATDNATSDLTLTKPATGAASFGVVVKWYNGTTCDVLVGSFLERLIGQTSGLYEAEEVLPLGHWECASFDAGAGPTAIAVNIPAPFHGKFLSVFAFTTVAPAGAGGTVTLTPTIAGTAVTGGAVTVATGDGKFTRKAGTSVTATDEFHEGDALALNESAVTALSGGAFELYAIVKRLPGV